MSMQPPAVCHGCLLPIGQRTLVVVQPNTVWHPACLRCAQCRCELQFHNSCTLRHGKFPFCTRHSSNAIINNGSSGRGGIQERSCALCQMPIHRGVWCVSVGGGRLLHYPHCLVCGVCGRQLQAGQRVILTSGNRAMLACAEHSLGHSSDSDASDDFTSEDDHEISSNSPVEDKLVDNSDNEDHHVEMSIDMRLLGGIGMGCSDTESTKPEKLLEVLRKPLAHLDCPPKQLQPPLHPNERKFSCLGNGRTASGSVAVSLSPSTSSQFGTLYGGKQTRMRTVLSENQLAALRACYATNPRPDSLTKEQLSLVTGLSCRVIRVWFQNKRCKDKKRQQQQQQQTHAGGGASMQERKEPRHDASNSPHSSIGSSTAKFYSRL